MHAITHFLPACQRGLCVACDGEIPPRYSNACPRWQGLGKRKEAGPGSRRETVASRAQAYVRREDHADQMRRPKAAWHLEQRKFASNSLAFFLQVNLELISFQDFSGCFPRRGDKGTHLRSKPDVEFCWSLVSMLRNWSCDSAARERGGGV